MKKVLMLMVLFLFNFSFASKIIFQPEKGVYKKGEKVCFYLKNNSDKIIYLPSTAPWVVLGDVKEYKLGEEREFKERPVYSPIANQVIVKLKPGQKKKWCWEQKTFKKDEKALAGNYKIRITVFENGKPKFYSFNVKVEPKYSDAK